MAVRELTRSQATKHRLYLIKAVWTTGLQMVVIDFSRPFMFRIGKKKQKTDKTLTERAWTVFETRLTSQISHACNASRARHKCTEST